MVTAAVLGVGGGMPVTVRCYCQGLCRMHCVCPVTGGTGSFCVYYYVCL